MNTISEIQYKDVLRFCYSTCTAANHGSFKKIFSNMTMYCSWNGKVTMNLCLFTNVSYIARLSRLWRDIQYWLRALT